MNMRALAAALGAGLLLALALPAGEASAQTSNPCRGEAYSGSATVTCTEAAGATANIRFAPPNIPTSGFDIPGVDIFHEGVGNVEVVISDGIRIVTSGASGVKAQQAAQSGAGGNIDFRMTGGSITRSGGGTSAAGVYVRKLHTPGNTIAAMSGGSISASGNDTYGVYLYNHNDSPGELSFTMSGGNIVTMGNRTWGVGIQSAYRNGRQEPKFVMTGGTIRTTGQPIARAGGLTPFPWGASHAVYVERSWNTGWAAIEMSDGRIETTGRGASGLLAYRGLTNGGHDGGASIVMTGGSITTKGQDAASVHAWVNDINWWQTRFRGPGTVDVKGDADIVAEGLGARGILGDNPALGSIDLKTSGEATIAAPFAVGIEARATDNDNAAGRLTIAHGAAVEAREVGVLASAFRSSGHTMGSGAQTANDAARTEPLIHVTSSGRVTVGDSVMNAFIRNRIAGDDGTLSDEEQAVLDSVTAGDSDALDTALAALPAAYDDDWKAEARSLLTKRAGPTGDAAQGHRAAEAILGLSRAGVRATAISHTAIADYVRGSDALSAAERTVLAAVLTGGDGLEAALTALPVSYTTAWKNQVRQHAATYNAGDVRVDVTGGAIDAEGNGVEALYAVPHDDNGAITVSVDEGASVMGGANGIYVRNAGAGTGSLRAQSVTVNGMVTGGTGAGVHLAGGGAVTVGATGEVDATSGVGVLADGGADLTATVSGTVTGDIRVDGGGDLTANVMAGGVVTGTIHDPQTPFTVADKVSIGRILYSAGGTVTVSGGGKLTGVEGKAVESAAGPLTVTVDDEGRVEGDILSGGALTANVMAGGVVTGTIHDPQPPFTVADKVSIGRILYSAGGTVTVSGGGKLTGVEGKAVESAAGALTVTVDDEGRVEGDILSGGALTATVMAGGVVTGTLRNPQTPLAVAGSIGRILYDSGGTVTVFGGGKLTGVEGKAVESAAGALTVTVSAEGRVEGDILSGGALTATVMAGGVVTGTLRNPASPLTVSGRVGRVLYDTGGTMTVAGGGAVTGVEEEGTPEAIRADAGNLDVTVSGEVTGDIVERGAGDLDIGVSGTVTGDIRGEGAGAHTVAVESAGAVTGTVRLPASAAVTISSARGVGRVHYDNGGAVTVNASGKIAGLEIEGVREAIRSDAGDLAVTVHGMVTGNIEARGDGDLTVTVSETGTVTGEIFGRGGGTHTVEIAEKARVLGTVHNPKSGTTVHGAAGRVLFDNGGALTVAATGSIAGVDGEAIRADAGDLDVTVAKGGMVTGRIEGRGAGAMTVTVSGAVTGAIHGKGAGKHEVTVASGGMVTGDIVDLDAGGLVASVAGRLAGSIEERGAGDLTATVTGTVTGGIRGMGAGSHTVSVQEGGAVAGTVHLPSGALTVAGSIGQVLYDNGGSVTVARGGAVTGVEGEAADAIRSAAGDLSVTVAGRVAGDIRALGGKLTLETAAGGVVTGTVHNPGSPLTVRGSVGRILYDNGGSVTVAAGGAITGVDNEGTIEVIRSAAGDLTVDVAARATVTGAIRGEGDGDLDVDVSGTVKGGIFGLGGGEHDVHVQSGGAVEGLIHLAASAVTVDGSAGSVRFDRGGTVAVGAEGRIPGLDGRAVHSAAGDLTVTVNGVVAGSVSDIGAGDLTVTVANALTGDVIGGGGGMHRLTVQSGAMFEGNVRGVEFIDIAGRAAGTLRVPEGNEVAVPAGGVLVGAEDTQGRRVAIVAEMGALNLNVDGRVEGAVDAPDAAAASMVTIGPDGVIDGKVTLAGAGSEVTVDGVAQSVDAPRGMVTVGENGRIEDGVPGAVALTVKAAEGESVKAVAERIGRVGTGVTVTLRRAGEEDEVLETDDEGRLAFDRGPEPRHRVYEALPSVLLALNALPAHGDRLASAGASRRAFARFDAAAGERRPASSTAQARHDYRRLGFEAGMEGAVGDNALVSVSVRHVRGRADVETDGGRVEITGTGARLSGAWLPGQDFYVSAQAAATLYEADLDSALDGALASDISGRGYAVGAEVGRRLDLGRVALTPRAGAAWSQVDMSSFTDAMDERIALDAGRRITARAGLRADADIVPGGAGGVFATVDVERELSGAMEMTAADTPLEAEAEATWLRLGLGGAHEWAGGRFALRAAANYAAAPSGNRDFSGNATLTVRF